MLDATMQDIRYAVRWLRRSPGFMAVAVASLALGIGLNTALFSVVDAILFRPLSVASPDQLVDVYTSGGDGDTYATSSYPDLLDIKAHNRVFRDMAGHSTMFAALNLQDRSRLALGEVVTGNYFQLLGVKAAVGRTLLPDDDRPGAEPVLMISHALWLREHGGDHGVVGRRLKLRGQSYAIVGVAPRAFTGMVPMLAPEIWVPLTHVGDVEPAGIQDVVPSPTGTSRLDRRGQRWLFVKGRLREGVTVEEARANLEVLMARLRSAHPQTNKDRTIAVKRTSEVRVHPAADALLLSTGIGLMVAVALVLVIACANVASMLLARATARQREISIRLAIGAGRGRLVRQLLTESLVLSVAGAGAGLALAAWLTGFVKSLNLPIPIPLTLDLRIDLRVLAFTASVSIASGVMAGLAPALKASRRDLVSDLRGDSSAARSAGRRWTLRDVLVTAQIAVTLVLLVGAALLTRSLAAAQRVDPGFPVDGLAVISADLDMLGYDRSAGIQFWDRAVERVRALPGVTSVALAARLPFSLNFHQESFVIPGYHSAADRPVTIQNSRVSPGYFETLGIPILQGRAFTAADTPDSSRVIVISEAMARRYWPGESAIGKRVHLRDFNGPQFEVVGISADHKVRSVAELPQPFVHFAQTQQPATSSVLVARTRSDAGALLARLRRELLSMEPNLVFIDNQTMEQQVSATLFPARAGAWLVSFVSAVAMALAGIGLYGVLAYSVARRTREIGVRMALGARPANVVALVLGQGLGVVGAGLVIGSLLAALSMRALGAVLYGVGVGDLTAWAGAIAVLASASAAANLIPAQRAARVNPSVALRSD